MTQTIHDSLQVEGDFNGGNTIYVVGHPVGLQDYVIDLLGSTPTSVPPMTALSVNGQSMGLDNLPGINTIILNPNGTVKAKHSHNTAQDPSQWNSWADWVNAAATNGDVVAVASYGVPFVGVPPQAGSAVTLLNSIHASIAWAPGPLGLLFVKGQTICVGAIWPPAPAPPFPPGSFYPAHIRTSYHRLLKPFSGRVGIGTTEPDAYLHVLGDEQSTTLRVSKTGGGDALQVQGSTELVGGFTVRGSAEFNPELGSGVALTIDRSWLPDPTFQGVTYTTRATLRCQGPQSGQNQNSSISFHTPGAPRTALVADGPVMSLESGAYFAGNVGIGTVTPQAKLHVEGDIIATGDIVLQNADCAEEFAVKDMELIEPGTVMVLGEEGSLCQSTAAYDKKVAGVISGAGDFKPGLILDKQTGATGRLAISLMGKAYCKVDAQYAPIEVGDLLTTSPTAGHAMKASDPLKAFGAIIGKALRAVAEGKGLIPILVALQ